MKRFVPLLCLILAMALAVGGALCLGGAGMSQKPDYDPALMRAGEMLAYMRDGQIFTLSDAYPDPWDRAQFASSGLSLRESELRLLFAYDPTLAQSDEPLLLLWQAGELRHALALPPGRVGYPQFLSGVDNRDFSLSRDDATFLCTFVPEGHNGYYQCTPEGVAATRRGGKPAQWAI